MVLTDLSLDSLSNSSIKLVYVFFVAYVIFIGRILLK